jgi:hypothetical protein
VIWNFYSYNTSVLQNSSQSIPAIPPLVGSGNSPEDKVAMLNKPYAVQYEKWMEFLTARKKQQFP